MISQKKQIIAAARARLPRLDPAHELIEALGGPTKVAREIGLTQPRVSFWSTPIENAGTGGRIPARHHAALIQLCKDKNVPYRFDDQGRLCLGQRA